MTYTAGSTIEATDYNGFVSTNGSAINYVWAGTTGDLGWGQTAISTVAATNTITAAQWASLVNILSLMGSQTNTALTSRSAPTAGTTISILSAVNTDITACTSNRGNAAGLGSRYTGWTGTNSKTTDTTGAFTLSFVNTVTFASADAARYFWNAGGLVKIQVGKSSTGQTGDPEWNDLATTLCGAIIISGRVAGAAQTIAGTSYSGVKQVGGTGTPTTLATTIGWYSIPADGTPTTIYKQYADSAPYTLNYIQHTMERYSNSLIIRTTWVNSEGDTITGGTAASGATPGTAPCTIVTYQPPSTTYLTNSWGTPTVAATTTTL